MSQALEKLVAELKEQPPKMDDLRRARLERKLLSAVEEGAHLEPLGPEESEAEAGPEAGPERGRRAPAWALAAGGMALAAAAALLMIFWPRPSTPELAVRPELRFSVEDEAGVGRRGTLDPGATLHTEEGETARLTWLAHEVALGEESALRIASLGATVSATGELPGGAQDTHLILDRGEITVGFHPAHRGQEHLFVETPSARVEVVGTVFSVRVEEGGATTVAVSEGVVRVVPIAGRASLVHAGERRHVEAVVAAAQPAGSQAADSPPAEAQAAGSSSEENSPSSSEAEEASAPIALTEEASAPTVAARHVPRRVASPSEARDPAQDPAPADESAIEERLREARRQLVHGNHAAARASLLEVTGGGASAPLRAEAWTLLAESSAATGELPAAVSAYERAAEVGRGRLAGHNALYSLARLKERRLHDQAGAIAAYRAYLGAAPRGALASQARRALCRLGEQAECADAPE